ncbi:MAG: DUF1667 domain-containing protein [Atopobiaceae bacterium]|nr:DUF1667 domain-containing protein [Atopobiaceae bacterium]
MMATEILNFTCVQCPMGCPLTVTLEDGVVTNVTGNTCNRGKIYGEHEATQPQRVVTSLINVKGDYHPVSVKTAAPVPKELVDEVLAEIARSYVEPPVKTGDVVVANVANCGVDVVCTKSRLV